MKIRLFAPVICCGCGRNAKSLASITFGPSFTRLSATKISHGYFLPGPKSGDTYTYYNPPKRQQEYWTSKQHRQVYPISNHPIRTRVGPSGGCWQLHFIVNGAIFVKSLLLSSKWSTLGETFFGLLATKQIGRLSIPKARHYTVVGRWFTISARRYPQSKKGLFCNITTILIPSSIKTLIV